MRNKPRRKKETKPRLKPSKSNKKKNNGNVTSRPSRNKRTRRKSSSKLRKRKPREQRNEDSKKRKKIRKNFLKIRNYQLQKLINQRRIPLKTGTRGKMWSKCCKKGLLRTSLIKLTRLRRSKPVWMPSNHRIRFKKLMKNNLHRINLSISQLPQKSQRLED